MSVEHVLLVVTAGVALLALVVALLALRALARIKAENRLEPAPTTPRPDLAASPQTAPRAPETLREQPTVQVHEGQVVVRPTGQQIVTTTLHHPLVRLNVLMVGLAHALRPESRDRIGSLMRREFRARKSERRKAGRRAARGVPAANSSTPLWISTEAPPRELPSRPLGISGPSRRELEA